MFKFKNILLNGLGRQNSAMLGEIQAVTLKQRDVLYDVGDKIDYVYFMESAVGSIITMMQDGSAIEVAMTGFEGVVGVAALLGENVSQQHVVIQLPGKAYRVKAATAKAEFESNIAFRNHVLSFVEAFIELGGQSAACNRLHQVEPRCARWLLMASDRTQSNVLPLTQDYLAVMVGVRRSGISEVAANFQRLGYIRYKKGKIEILDRDGLEKVACECYHVNSDRVKRLIKKIA